LQLLGDSDGDDVEVQVAPGGSAFIDIEPEAGLQGHVDLTIEIGDDDHLDKYRFSTILYEAPNDETSSGLPKVCKPFRVPIFETYESELGTFGDQLQVDAACTTATLVITNIDPNSGDRDGDSFTVGAEFNDTTEASGIEIASVDSDEHQGNDDSRQPSIASDGGSVVFASDATDLVASDVGAGTEIYRRSLTNPFEDGDTVLVSGGDDDVDNDDSGYPVASGDGQVVAFASLDDDLDTTAEPSDGAQVYVADLDEETIDRVSLFEPVTGQVAAAGRPSISADGRYVAYEGGGYTGLDRPGSPSGISAIYLYDRETEDTVCLSCVGFGVPTALSFEPEIADNGSMVVFSSAESTLVAGDTNGVSDIFGYRLVDDSIVRVSRAPGGGQSTAASSNPRTGPAFRGIFVYQQGSNIHVVRSNNYFSTYADRELVDLSGDGYGSISYSDGSDVFLDCPFGEIEVRTVAIGIGGQPNGVSRGGSLSNFETTYVGTTVAFTSGAENLVANDENGKDDVFTRPAPACAEG